MGSPLGDYIHLDKTNYLKYGVNKEKGNNDFIQQLTKQEALNNKRKNNLNINNVEQIIEKLNGRFKTLTDNGYIKKIQQQSSKAESDIIQEVEKNFIDFLNTWFNGENYNNEHSQLSIEVIPTIFYKIQRARENINKALQRINREGYKYKKQSLDTINNNLIKIRDAIKEAVHIQTKENFKINLEDDQTLQNFYNSLSNLYLISKNNSNLQGKKGETIASILQNNVDDLTANTLEKLISTSAKNIVGEERTTISYKENDAFLGKTDTIINIGKTQDKVDVTIIIDNQPLNISVKNYYSNTDTIYPELQEVNLFYTLLNTAEKFGTHWINMHSLISKDFKTNKDAADIALQEQIKYEALVSGNLLKQRQETAAKLSNFFIGMDSKNEKFIAIDTKSLLNQNIFTITPDIKSQKIINRKHPKGETERINNILLNLQKEKITVRAKIALNRLNQS